MPNASNSSSGLRGLSTTEAAARLSAEGFNELPQADRRTPFRIVLEVLREPMLALLLFAGVIYLALGDLKEALVLLAFACLSVLITVVQESRTERVLEALRDLTSPRALVIRDGERQRIAGREVVRGDLIVLAEGDRVPADACLVEGQDLQADESLLTGESAPVRKTPQAGPSRKPPRPGGDDLPFAYSGTLIVRGTGIAEVVATGAASEIGKIGVSLGALATEVPHLRTETRKLVNIFALGGGIVSVLVVVLYGALRGDWLDALLAGIAVGMSMLPQEFPVVLTVFLAMGAWRISQARVLTRRAAAIETLGSATVLCTDKTGTLTENHMRIAELRSATGAGQALVGAQEALPGAFGDLVAFGMLASAAEPFDPMEKAFHALAKQGNAEVGSIGVLAKTYPLRPDLLAMTQVWTTVGEAQSHIVAAKGAPEAIADLCRLGAEERAKLAAAVDDMAKAGRRVLGVARATFAGSDFPKSQRDFHFEYLGLAGLADPLRPSVPAAVAECGAAGIRVVMITGDYPATARAIAGQAGMDCAEVITGAELEKLNDEALASRVRITSIFARIMPDQKLRVVKALKANNEIVAMTGDGVNDAPSLKAAHIGVAMGGRGTDVAREASSIVLLDDDFGSIVTTVRLGRRIYDNLRKAMSFIFAVHVPIAGLALLPLILGMPIVFGPMHIAFLEMIIDPVCSLVFEAEVEEDDLMRRPPRDPGEPLFSAGMIFWSVFQGAFAFALLATTYIVALRRGMPADEVRALTFFSLVISIVALIFVNRSTSASLFKAFLRPNRALAVALPAVAAMLAVTLLWPVARDLFRFGPLHVDDLSFTLSAGLVVLVVLELLKLLGHSIFAPRAKASAEMTQISGKADQAAFSEVKHERTSAMSTTERYGTVAIALHWWIALLILAAFGLGLTVDNFPKDWTGTIINLHALIGLAVLVLTFGRFGWRMTHLAPELPTTIGPLMHFASRGAQAVLYILMVAIPLIGIPTLLYRGRGLDFGLFKIASPFARTPEVFRPLTEIHEIASFALIGLAACHALAAIYHHFIRRDDVLRSMLPPHHS